MNKYRVVSIIWDDHTYMDRTSMLKNPDDGVTVDISFGIIYKETEKVIVLVHNIESYEAGDDSCYTVILKSAIQAIQDYGEIELAELRS